MSDPSFPVAIEALATPLGLRESNDPEPLASLMSGRGKRPLGDLFGLSNLGVNLTRLASSALSALRQATKARARTMI